MELTKSEKERYDRHLQITDFDELRQLRLRQAKVLVVGAGGLGCPVIQYLVAAGVGYMGVVDGDVVSLSNLQRQILYAEDEVGDPKADLAADKMRRLNSSVHIEVYRQLLDESLAEKIFSGYDVVLGCTDNFRSRYLIDAFSKKHSIPFVHGSIHEFEGQLCVFNFQGGASYADVFGDEPSASAKPVGVIGALPGIVGSLMAMEAIKIITGMGEVCSSKLMLFNALNNSFSHLKI